jgi:hypothetical protein
MMLDEMSRSDCQPLCLETASSTARSFVHERLEGHQLRAVSASRTQIQRKRLMIRIAEQELEKSRSQQQG